MKEKDYTGQVPENREGKEITATASIHLNVENEAISHFSAAKERLMNIGEWHNTAEGISARFQLKDLKGGDVHRWPEEGDYIRIDIPGPGIKAGEGYDWVRIEEIKEVNSESVDSIAITVRPASNPSTDNDSIAHFYSGQSTSTFVITRENNSVTAAIYDRNIESNRETTEPIDKIRNAVIGLGAKQGFSKLQWQALANGLVKA